MSENIDTKLAVVALQDISNALREITVLLRPISKYAELNIQADYGDEEDYNPSAEVTERGIRFNFS